MNLGLRYSRWVANYLRLPYNAEALREIVEQTLPTSCVTLDDPTVLPHVHENRV